MIKIPILIYHAIETDDNPITLDSKGELIYVLNSDKFQQQMEYLIQNGHKAISLEDYVASVNHQAIDGKDNAVIITFDDGHITNYTAAFPILQKFGIMATFFITVKTMNKPDGLNTEQLKEMAKYGMSIQSHTMTHPFLSDLSSKEIRRELQESKDILENELGQAVDYLALPGGCYSSTAREIAME